jgi:hypothetical protein
MQDACVGVKPLRVISTCRKESGALAEVVTAVAEEDVVAADDVVVPEPVVELPDPPQLASATAAAVAAASPNS